MLIDQYTFYIRGHFSKETYYRLVLPELLPNYDKVLYLDSEMIAMDDVAKSMMKMLTVIFWQHAMMRTQPDYITDMKKTRK